MYAFENQPAALAVHMKQLAVALSALVPDARVLEEALGGLWPAFRHHRCAAAPMLMAGTEPGVQDSVVRALTGLAAACCAEDHAATLCALADVASVVEGLPAPGGGAAAVITRIAAGLRARGS